MCTITIILLFIYIHELCGDHGRVRVHCSYWTGRHEDEAKRVVRMRVTLQNTGLSTAGKPRRQSAAFQYRRYPVSLGDQGLTGEGGTIP